MSTAASESPQPSPPTPWPAPARVEQLRQQVAELDAQISARRPQPGQLFIVDEASLAGTLALDELVTAANCAGAKVLLVGDPHQLSAVEAGGAFGLVAGDRGDLAPQLSEVRRFVHDWEKTASLDLRRGQPEAIDAYQAHGRVVGGDRDQLLEAVYQAWKTDTDAGRSSLMIAGDTATVAELNRRARSDRVAAGEVAHKGIEVAGGQLAGVGDLVVTRRNERRLSTRSGWVKNGDRWVVTGTHEDGSMTVHRTYGDGQAVLPADYAAQHVELAYATTAHQAEGRTVDTAHALVSPATTREVLYVSATRGRVQPSLRRHRIRSRSTDRTRGDQPALFRSGGSCRCPRQSGCRTLRPRGTPPLVQRRKAKEYSDCARWNPLPLGQRRRVLR